MPTKVCYFVSTRGFNWVPIHPTPVREGNLDLPGRAIFIVQCMTQQDSSMNTYGTPMRDPKRPT